MREKGFALTVLIGVIAIIFSLVSGGAFVFFKLQKDKKPQIQTVEQEEIVNWKTYTSQIYGYEIKYPPDWTFREIPADEIDRIVFGPQEELNERITASNVEDVEDINNISILKLFSKFSLETVLASYNFKESGKNLLVADYSARQFEKPFTNEQPGVSYITTFIKRGDDIFVVAANFLPSEFTVNKALNKDKLKRIHEVMLSSMKFTLPKTTQVVEEQPISTDNWQSYTNPEFGYSFKIPPGWQEKVDSSTQQKRFRVYGSQGTPSDEAGKFEAELQILTLSFDNPAVKGNKSDFDRFRKMSPGTEETINGALFKKIKNVNLDGCEAPQFLFYEGDYKHGYSTSCDGESRYISLLLLADQQNIVEKYKSIYDAVMASFKFNKFKL